MSELLLECGYVKMLLLSSLESFPATYLSLVSLSSESSWRLSCTCHHSHNTCAEGGEEKRYSCFFVKVLQFPNSILTLEDTSANS